jgi:acetylornithine deacetylase/succinyl-diaminopimelate desuccinylase-like protein
VMLDIRTAAESPNSLVAFIDKLAGDWPHEIFDDHAPEPDSPPAPSDETIYGYYTPPESELVARAKGAIEKGMGKEAPLSRYEFATDGRHFVPHGLQMIGFAAGDEDQAHIADESIRIDLMLDSLRAHVQLLRDF